jgi:hypothetical protein
MLAAAHLRLASAHMQELMVEFEEDENAHDMSTVEDIRALLGQNVLEAFCDDDNYIDKEMFRHDDDEQ